MLNMYFYYFIVRRDHCTTRISISVSMIWGYLYTESFLSLDQNKRLWCGSMYSLHSLLFLPNENSTFLICSITTLWEIRKRSRKIWFMARSDLSLALHFAQNDHVWWILLYSCFSYLSCYSCLRFPIDTAVLFMIYLVMNILVHSCYL